MQRIILSLALIALVGGALTYGATTAFFSDTETSTGNTFAAGALDLKVDNESYYNGNVCAVDVDDVDEDQDMEEYVWQGEAAYPVPGTDCRTSFPESDLDEGFVFFDFEDLKPDDEGEDTISLHVQNDAWACMDLTLTSNDDVSTTEPEGQVDDVEDPNDPWDGELGSALQFFWWADDGDNVYEEGEAQITEGVEALIDLAPQGESFSVALADAENNVWDPEDETPSPLPGNETVYIAKAWCMGDLTLAPLAQDNSGEERVPNDEDGPGVVCDGSVLGNESQTDAVELNVVFTTVQARHNGDFVCNDDEDPGPENVTLTVNKIIVADTEGIGVEDFELHIDGPEAGAVDDQVVGDNVPTTGLPAGTYNVYEVILEAGLPPGVTFNATFGGACDESGNVTIEPGANVVCTITNVEVEPTALIDENFGSGACLTNIPGWDEDAGESCVNGTVAKDAGGVDDDTISPDGGRHGLLSGNNGYICRSVNASGIEDLELSYYWRGDVEAEDGETGSVSYFTSGTCAAPGALTSLASHELDDGNNGVSEAWSALQTISLPPALDNSSFFIRFSADSNGGNESFRVDGVTLEGMPI